MSAGGLGAGLRSGQAAGSAGVNPQTLRYYERRGLLPEPERSLGGHRLYPVETVTLLRIIKTAQRLGFTLAEVAELIEAGGHRHRRAAARGRPDRPGDSGLRSRAAAKLSEVERKIVDLEIIRDTLREALAAGCDDLGACAASPNCPIPFTGLDHPSGGSDRR